MNPDRNLECEIKAEVTNVMGICLLLVAALTTPGFAQTALIDDFSDGNADGWSTIDSTIGRHYGPGIFDASSNAYHLETAGVTPPGASGFLIARWDRSSDPAFADGTLRAKVRAGTQGTLVSLMLRLSGSLETGFNGYQFGASTFAGPFGAFAFAKIMGSRTVSIRPLDASLNFDVAEDWYIEAGAVGDQISMKVWRAGESEPASPQLVFTDSSFSTGAFALETAIDVRFRQPAQINATFDDVHFSFPEHDDVFTVSPYNVNLWQPPMPVPQVEGPFFTANSPEKPDMRGDVTTAEAWPDLRITGQVTDPNGLPIPGLKLDFWQVDDLGHYDNSGGYALRGHLYTNSAGHYDLWTVMPAAYETIRTRHLHVKIGGENLGFNSPVYTTQFYFPVPFDNDINADGVRDKVIEGGVTTPFDAIALAEDFVTLADLEAVGARFADLKGNTMTLNSDPTFEGYFDAMLDIMMPQVFQSPKMADRILIDNFNDGNADGWTTFDASLGLPYGPAIFDANSGAYHFEGGLVPVSDVGAPSTRYALWGGSSDPMFSQGFVRAIVRAETEGTAPSVLMRASSSPETGLTGYMFLGTTHFGGRFFFNKIVNNRLVLWRQLPREFSFGLNEDWIIEAGAVGDELSMKVWRVGDPEPESPQWTFIDSTLSTGQIGLEAAIDGLYPRPARLSATFDDITFEFAEPDIAPASGRSRGRE